jgi:PAS domain S-box-containing protein
MKLVLAESLSILQSIVESMDVGLYVLDRNLRIQAVNTKGSRWLAKDDAAACTECYREIHGKGHACENCPTLRTFKSGKTERLQMKVEHGGQSRYYSLTASPLRLEKDQEFSYVVEMVQDITAEKRASEEISRLNDFNKAIIDNAPVAIFTLDRHGTFTSVNPALALISGLGSEAEAKLIGFNWLKNPYTIKSGLAAHLKRGLRGEAFQLEDFLFNTYRGDRPHYIDFKGVPLRGKDGQLEGLLCIIEETTHRVNEKKLLNEKNIALKEHLQRVDVRDTFIGESASIKKVRTLISLVARSDTPVLILGETGTGKELVARAIHAQSLRSTNPFVVINSSALQENMVESELFGHKKGAFTGANADKLGLLKIAHSGTFFMDEVGDLNSSIQAKFLRVLETGAFRRLGDTQEISVDVRFIFATNKDLEREVMEKSFRKDLFYRLNGFTVIVPPLRERKEDIPLLLDYFLRKFARGGRKKTITEPAMALLIDYAWPGNVRELANAVERVVLISANRDEIEVGDFPQSMRDVPSGIEEGRAMPSEEQVAALSQMERDYVRSVLNSVGGNKSKAARILGISRRTLYRAIGKPM